MKVLLIIPPRSHDPLLGFSKFPDEVFTIAAVLEKDGNEVQIYDNNTDSLNDRRHPVDFLSYNPDVVGFSVVTNYQITSAIAQSIEFKNLLPDTKVVWGGMHPSMLPEQTLVEPYIDYVVIGCGEYTMLELVNSLKGDTFKFSDIKGLAYKEHNRVIINQSRPFLNHLDELPDPAWHLVDVNRYREKTICTSRGCPRDCAFCSNSAFYQGHVGDLSAKRIVSQMEHLHDKYGVKFFWFAGENFAFKYKRLKEFCDLIVSKKLKVTWNCEVSDVPPEENIALMAKSGCASVYIMVESGSQRMLSFLHKKYTVAEIEKAFWLFTKYKIMPTLFTMCGLPTETTEDLDMSNELLRRLDNPPYLNARFVPYPNTSLYDYCMTRGLINPPQKLADWPKYAELFATKANLSDVPQVVIKEATANFGRSVAARRVIFAMRHNPSYFWKVLRDPMGFFRDLRSLRKYYQYMGETRKEKKKPKLREQCEIA